MVTGGYKKLLRIVSAMFTICVLITNYFFIYGSDNTYNAIFIGAALVVGIIEIVLIHFLYITTSIEKNITQQIDKIIKKYLDLAADIGLTER